MIDVALYRNSRLTRGFCGGGTQQHSRGQNDRFVTLLYTCHVDLACANIVLLNMHLRTRTIIQRLTQAALRGESACQSAVGVIWEKRRPVKRADLCCIYFRVDLLLASQQSTQLTGPPPTASDGLQLASERLRLLPMASYGLRRPPPASLMASESLRGPRRSPPRAPSTIAAASAPDDRRESRCGFAHRRRYLSVVLPTDVSG